MKALLLRTLKAGSLVAGLSLVTWGIAIGSGGEGEKAAAPSQASEGAAAAAPAAKEGSAPAQAAAPGTPENAASGAAAASAPGAIGGTPQKTAAHEAPPAELSESECIDDQVVLKDLRKRQRDIEAKEKEVLNHEAEIAARERALNDEIKKLQDLKASIQVLNETNAAKNEENVAKLVDLLEKMSPKSAAQVLSKADDALALAAMKRINTPQLAKMMNGMDPGRATKLSEMLAGVSGRTGVENIAGGVNAPTTGAPASTSGGGRQPAAQEGKKP